MGNGGSFCGCSCNKIKIESEVNVPSNTYTDKYIISKVKGENPLPSIKFNNDDTSGRANVKESKDYEMLTSDEFGNILKKKKYDIEFSNNLIKKRMNIKNKEDNIIVFFIIKEIYEEIVKSKRDQSMFYNFSIRKNLNEISESSLSSINDKKELKYIEINNHLIDILAINIVLFHQININYRNITANKTIVELIFLVQYKLIQILAFIKDKKNNQHNKEDFKQTISQCHIFLNDIVKKYDNNLFY